jgi:hypothetical protein
MRLESEGYYAARKSERGRTEIESAAHADWMRGASRMLDEEGRAERGVERSFAGWFCSRSGAPLQKDEAGN